MGGYMNIDTNRKNYKAIEKKIQSEMLAVFREGLGRCSKVRDKEVAMIKKQRDIAIQKNKALRIKIFLLKNSMYWIGGSFILSVISGLIVKFIEFS